MNSTKHISSNVMGKTILFRCEASQAIGMGHVMRCLSLAQALQQEGWHCIFLSSPETRDFCTALKKSDFEIRKPEDVVEADFLVVDSYKLDISYEQTMRSLVKRIIVIDDLADRKHDCDILIDQTFGRNPEDYKLLVPSDCVMCCGSNFTILRQQFSKSIEKAKIKRQAVAQVDNILVSYGSTNPQQIIQKTLNALARFSGRSLNINVVTTTGAQDIAEIEEICSNMTRNTPHHASLALDVTDMASFMLSADIAFGGGGTTSWERASLGLPTLLIELSPDQKYVSENLEKLGALKRIGHVGTVQEADIDKAFENMRDNSDLLRKMSQKAFTICDGKGAERLCKIIQKAAA